jgi:flagellar basal-body rod protein FlgG
MMALRTAATGMAAQDLNVDVISNNIANMNTVGYKKQRAEFEDLLYQDIQRPGAQSSDTGTIVPTGIQIGAGVTAGSVYRITTQGSPTQTGSQYDLAINGKGFFQVLLPSGEISYTRAGNFSPNANGQLVTTDGYLVQPQITIPQGTTAVSISPSGQVQATIPGQTTPTVVGQLTLATFLNEGGLEATGDNLFMQTAASGPPTLGNPNTNGVGALIQGSIESSNVDPVTEITALIVAQRAYEMNSKVVTSADQMLSTTNAMKQ